MSAKNRKLYRYISYKSFTDLVQEGSLRFVRPKLWDDTHEGYLFQKMKTDSGRMEIRKILDSHFSDSSVVDIFFDHAVNFEKTFYAQSWSLCPDSDAMWRIYSYDNTAIRIEVSESNIAKIPKIEIMDVVYEEKIDLLSELNRVGLSQDRTDFAEIFRMKRRAFSHEEEVRLVYRRHEAINEMSDEKADIFAKALKGTTLEGLLTTITQNTAQIKFSDIPSFFESICLHPRASDELKESVESFCQTNALTFIGKSKLYGNVV